MWNPLKTTEEPKELTAQEERDLRVNQVDSKLRQAQSMFNMFIDSLEEVMTDIEGNKATSEAEIEYHRQEIAAEEKAKARLEKRESEATKVLNNVKKNFTINLDDKEEEEDAES